jgi:hypothetical protein
MDKKFSLNVYNPQSNLNLYLKYYDISEIHSRVNTIPNAFDIDFNFCDIINNLFLENNEEIIKTTEELLNCYKSLLANNECQKNSYKDVSNTTTSTEEKIISSTAYQKVKQDLIDLNSDLKNNKQLIKIVEKKSSITTDQSVNDSKTRMTAYNILNDCFNNFRLKYLSSMRWF